MPLPPYISPRHFENGTLSYTRGSSVGDFVGAEVSFGVGLLGSLAGRRFFAVGVSVGELVGSGTGDGVGELVRLDFQGCCFNSAALLLGKHFVASACVCLLSDASLSALAVEPEKLAESLPPLTLTMPSSLLPFPSS